MADVATKVAGSVEVISDPFDDVYWNITYQLDKSYNAYGQERFFHVALPLVDVYDDPPVLMYFHGGYGDGANSAESTKFNVVAGESGFVTIFAEGYEMPEGGRKWSAGSLAGACSVNASEACYIDDVTYVAGAIDGMISQGHMTQNTPFFIAGHSNGGFMSYRLLCELDHKITGAAPVESSPGWYNADECLVDCGDENKLCYSAAASASCAQANWNTDLPQWYECPGDKMQSASLITFQGLKDDHVLYEGGQCTSNNCGGNMSVVPYPFQVTFNAQLNDCDPGTAPKEVYFNESSSDPADSSACFEYASCAHNTVYCVQYNGGHVYPGKQFSECDEASPDYNADICAYRQWYTGPTVESLHATNLIVDFFSGKALSP